MRLVVVELEGGDETLLDEGERARWQRLRRPQDRQRFLAVHSALRRVLSRHAPVAPADWRFRRDEGGRSWIAGPEHGLYFSTSHAPGLAAILVGQRPELGVDLERVGRVDDPGQVALGFFSAAEQATLAASEAPQRLFAQHWALKEAWSKARGGGLDLPVERAGFEVRQEGVEVEFLEDLDVAARWRFHLLEPRPGYQLAVAVGGGAPWPALERAP